MRVVGPNSFGLINNDPAVRLNASLAPRLPPHGGLGPVRAVGALGHRRARLGRPSQPRHLDVRVGRQPGRRLRQRLHAVLDRRRLHRRGRPLPRVDGQPAQVLPDRPQPGAASSRSSSSSRGSPPSASRPATGCAAPRPAPRRSRRCSSRPASSGSRTSTSSSTSPSWSSHQPLPAGDRVAVVGNSDALGTLTADACTSWDLDGRRTVRSRCPPRRRPTSSARPSRAAFADPKVDSVLTCFIPPLVTDRRGRRRRGARRRRASPRSPAWQRSSACAASTTVTLGDRDTGRLDPRRPGLRDARGRRARPRRRHPLRRSGGPRTTARRSTPSASTGAAPRTSSQHGARRRTRRVAARPRRGVGAAAGLRHRRVGPRLVRLGRRGGRRRRAGGLPGRAQVDLADAAPPGRRRAACGSTCRTEASLRAAVESLRERLAPLDADRFVVQKMATPGVPLRHRPPTRTRCSARWSSFSVAGPPTELLDDIAYRIPPLTDVDVTDLISSVQGRPGAARPPRRDAGAPRGAGRPHRAASRCSPTTCRRSTTSCSTRSTPDRRRRGARRRDLGPPRHDPEGRRQAGHDLIRACRSRISVRSEHEPGQGAAEESSVRGSDASESWSGVPSAPPVRRSSSRRSRATSSATVRAGLLEAGDLDAQLDADDQQDEEGEDEDQVDRGRARRRAR